MTDPAAGRSVRGLHKRHRIRCLPRLASGSFLGAADLQLHRFAPDCRLNAGIPRDAWDHSHLLKIQDNKGLLFEGFEKSVVSGIDCCGFAESRESFFSVAEDVLKVACAPEEFSFCVLGRK